VAIKDRIANVRKIRGFVGVYLDVPELTDQQANALKVDLVQLDRNLEALETELEESSPPPTVERFSGVFKDFGDDSVTYLFGGSPGNPDGVSFTYAQAKAWWAYVFANGLNIGHVRPTLLPGSEVLADDGMALAVALGESSDIFAPEDFNPLGLEVIP
jgi:hypothetical protein